VSLRRLPIVALLYAAALVLGSAWPAAAGEDSPWPRTNALWPNVRAVEREVSRLDAQVELMELSADRYDDWETCISHVPVSEYGDPDRQFGYLYDARDGTGVSHFPGLAVDRYSRPRKEDYMFLDFAREGDCRSEAPLPGGTADPASVRSPLAPAPAGPARPFPSQSREKSALTRKLKALDRTVARAFPSRSRNLARRVRSLERKVRRLARRAQRLETASERFDEWESCVSWVPVTEYGDPEGRYGYLFGARGVAPGYMPGLAIDRSDWDDPDYMFLALVGGDRPGRTCQDEPGEAID
jgi:hypothetical protein